ncbi:hypothetical protein V1318_19105 [Lysobacter sp. CCNWLW3]|uniref:hypothetical protein n=1 Tax=unclassified Lysobacter TaxID=2635362 RepID=UPI002FD3CECB
MSARDAIRWLSAAALGAALASACARPEPAGAAGASPSAAPATASPSPSPAAPEPVAEPELAPEPGDPAPRYAETEVGPMPERPRVPMRIEGACPFECCKYDAWIATAQTRVYSRELDSAQVLTTVPAGTRLRARGGFLQLTRFGEAEALKPLQIGSGASGDDSVRRVAEGDKVIVLDGVGEGLWRIWHDGVVDLRLIDEREWVLEHRDGFDRNPEAGLVWNTEPESQWWAQVRLPDGRLGWLWMDETPALKNVDGCG